MANLLFDLLVTQKLWNEIKTDMHGRYLGSNHREKFRIVALKMQYFGDKRIGDKELMDGCTSQLAYCLYI